MSGLQYIKQVEKWGVFEVSVPGYSKGNPFVDYEIRGIFTGQQEQVAVDGFYDGSGIYKVRFMPSFEGTYTFRLTGSYGVEEAAGSFTVTPPAAGNHGPVRVANTYHFTYEDGTPYYSMGTTCYVWALQEDERIKATLAQLQKSAFNKIRFCIFPKHYDYNLGEPRAYPYAGTPMDSSVLTEHNFLDYTGRTEGNHWDFTRFNPDYFQHMEACIAALGRAGIEADVIVMHPYDRWGFAQMTKVQDTLYWKYVIARFAAYRNVWWSLANEYDLMEKKTIEDWEHYAALLVENDPYNHLRSVHNCKPFYDYTRPWITHCSIQRQDTYKSSELVDEWRIRYRKPVVLDEIAYEGNIQHGWGNISGEELVRRCWEGVCRGGYPGHSETYLHPEGVLWWSHGGELHGESNRRLAFLYDVMCDTPGIGLMPYRESGWDEVCAVPEEMSQQIRPVKDYYLIYYSFMRPSFRDYYFDDDTTYQVKVLDTWNMTVEDQGVVKGKFRVILPGRMYMAVQIKKAEE